MLSCGLIGEGGPSTVDEESANEVLSQAKVFAVAHDIESLCGMGGSEIMCQRFWQDAGGWEAMPTEDPTIVESYVIESVPLSGGQQRTGGLVLVLEGLDGLGRPYQTDFFIFDAGSHGLAPYNPVYWSGMSLGKLDLDELEETAPSQRGSGN